MFVFCVRVWCSRRPPPPHRCFLACTQPLLTRNPCSLLPAQYVAHCTVSRNTACQGVYLFIYFWPRKGLRLEIRICFFWFCVFGAVSVTTSYDGLVSQKPDANGIITSATRVLCGTGAASCGTSLRAWFCVRGSCPADAPLSRGAVFFLVGCLRRSSRVLFFVVCPAHVTCPRVVGRFDVCFIQDPLTTNTALCWSPSS